MNEIQVADSHGLLLKLQRQKQLNASITIAVTAYVGGKGHGRR
jgi:hypothetical protein